MLSAQQELEAGAAVIQMTCHDFRTVIILMNLLLKRVSFHLFSDVQRECPFLVRSINQKRLVVLKPLRHIVRRLVIDHKHVFSHFIIVLFLHLEDKGTKIITIYKKNRQKLAGTGKKLYLCTRSEE